MIYYNDWLLTLIANYNHIEISDFRHAVEYDQHQIQQLKQMIPQGGTLHRRFKELYDFKYYGLLPNEKNDRHRGISYPTLIMTLLGFKQVWEGQS